MQQVAGLLSLGHAIAVITERQIRIGTDCAESVNWHTDGYRDQARGHLQHRGLGQQHFKVGKVEVQFRQLVSEQGGISTGDELGPVADVRDVRHKLQARTLLCSRLAAHRLLAHFFQLGIELVNQEDLLGGLLLHQLTRHHLEVWPPQMQQAAQRHARGESGQAVHHLGHLQRELHRIDETPVQCRLVGIGNFPNHVDHAAQRGVIGDDQVQTHDGRGQGRDHFAERLHRQCHLLGNRHQEIEHGRLQIKADVLDRNIGYRHRLFAQTPIPIEREIALQLGQTHHPQLHAQVQVCTHLKHQIKGLERIGQHRVQRHAVGTVALEVQRQQATN